MTNHGDLTLYRRLMEHARPYWLHIAAVFLLSILSTPVSLLGPLPLKIVVDSVLGNLPLPPLLEALLPEPLRTSASGILVLAAALVVLVALGSGIQDLASSLMTAYTTEKLSLGFRSRLFNHAQRLSLSYHDLKGTPDTVYRIQYDATALPGLAISGLIPFFSGALTLVSMLYVTFMLDWQVALVAVSISPVLFVLSRAYRKSLREQSREVKRLESSAWSVVHEALTAIRVVKAFGQEDREEERYNQLTQKGIQARMHSAATGGSFSLLITLITAGGTAMVMLIGVGHVQSGILTLGNLLLLMAYLSQLYAPLKTISKTIGSIQNSLASMERAFALLDEAPDVPEKPNALHLSRAVGAIAFREVSFAYQAGGPVIHDISFEVQPGMRIGITGATGAGKTTLVGLLTRFYDPTQGEILLDGMDLRDYKLADLRDQFAIVLQDTILFSTSVADNIAYARPGASMSEIVQAAKAANAHEFIERLPEGYDTLVGERGMRLSGGERQRISLARAFLKDARILILDEPTSSVDVATEAAIMDAIERLTRGRTSFLITHRLKTLEDCDRLLVVDHGRSATITSDVEPYLESVLDKPRSRSDFRA